MILVRSIHKQNPPNIEESIDTKNGVGAFLRKGSETDGNSIP